VGRRRERESSGLPGRQSQDGSPFLRWQQRRPYRHKPVWRVPAAPGAIGCFLSQPYLHNRQRRGCRPRGAAGGDGNTSGPVGGAGGIGLSSSITGSAVYYAGGGGGAAQDGGTGGAGGNGGGGDGGVDDVVGSDGTVNTGGGAGAGSVDPQQHSVRGASGGSGVVILRIPTANYSGTTSGSPTVTTDGDYKVVKFTGSGTYTA